MNQQQGRLSVLLKMHARNALSNAEREELSALLLEEWNQEQQPGKPNEPDWEKMLLEITGNENGRLTKRVPLFRRNIMRYAAVLIAVAGTLVFFYFNQAEKKLNVASSVQPKVKQPDDALPGVEKAVLTLSDGHRIALQAQGQQTISDGSLSIKNQNGNLVYTRSDVVVVNTMSTSKGGQYRLSLPDGTKVWLNAASSITFPTSFPGSKRQVSITGEVYFEVTSNPNKPFEIKTPQEQVAVLGTDLNVNTYTDEPSVKVSLLEGSVRVAEQLLKPGEAYFKGKVKKTNLEQDLAWKNGVFSFDKTRIDAVMRQLSRWYDIEVNYPDGIPELIISGSMGRDLKLSQVLSGLKGLGVHAGLENNILIVKR